MTQNVEALKRLAAESAVSRAGDGMIVGLGSGSTASIAIELLGDRVKGGLKILGVPTSEKSAAMARELGIPLAPLTAPIAIDLTIDGADEVEAGTLNLIKGRGGALLREKIVASASQRFVIVVDEQKIVGRLGAHGEVPVEVVPFGWQNTARNLQSLGWNPGLRVGSDGEPYRTDGGHYILDCSFVLKSATLESRCAELDRTVGVVEHGLFLNMATEVHVADAAGVRILLPG